MIEYILVTIFSIFLLCYYLPKVYNKYCVLISAEYSHEISIKERLFLIATTLILVVFINQDKLLILLTPIYISICYFDLKLRIIPDRFHFFAIITMCAYYLLFSDEFLISTFDIICILFIFLFLGLSNFLYKKFRKKEGVGFGDIKLLFWMSFLLKSDILLIIFVSSFLAVLVQGLKFVIVKAYSKNFPFAPYIIASMYCYYLLK